MKKLYFNNYYNKGLLINEGLHTYTLLSAETLHTIKADKSDFKGWARIEYMRELLKLCKSRGFKKVK